MISYFPSGVSDQRASDGNGCFLPGYRKTNTGNYPFFVPPDCLFAPSDLIAAAGIRGGRCIMGRPAGRRVGFYNDFDYVEIILEKNLGGTYAGKDYKRASRKRTMCDCRKVCRLYFAGQKRMF